MVVVNLGMSEVVLPRLETGFLDEARWGATSLAAVSGDLVGGDGPARRERWCWSWRTAGRLLALRETMDAGANASVLPVLNTASMVGFGAVVAALPAFAGVLRRAGWRSQAARWSR